MVTINEENKNLSNDRVLISVIVPSYKCEDFLIELYQRLIISIEKISTSFEIILINDGSPNNDWEIIKHLVAKDSRVKGINFTRNFGQHQAIMAGLEQAKGTWIIVMDGDLQDLPEEIEKLYDKGIKGNDVVFAQRNNRNDVFLKKLNSKMFYKVLSFFTDKKQDETIANFGIYHHSVIDSVIKMKESFIFFPLSVRWIGSHWVSIEVKHAKRCSGKTGYSFKKLVTLALDVIISYSNKPLRMIVNLGFLISFLSIACSIYVVIRALMGVKGIVGWPSLIISVWFLAGLIIFVLGVIGIYIGKIFNETKGRPKFIIKEIQCQKN